MHTYGSIVAVSHSATVLTEPVAQKFCNTSRNGRTFEQHFM